MKKYIQIRRKGNPHEVAKPARLNTATRIKPALPHELKSPRMARSKKARFGGFPARLATLVFVLSGHPISKFHLFIPDLQFLKFLVGWSASCTLRLNVPLLIYGFEIT